MIRSFDYLNLWFWHVAFNFPGSLNDINIWGLSPLHRSFIDGTFSDLDFDFEIGEAIISVLSETPERQHRPTAAFLMTMAIVPLLCCQNYFL